MRRRVALAGFLHETNTFAPTRATYSNFEQGGGYLPISRGEEITERCAGANFGIAGAVEHARMRGWAIRPILWAGAIPSAHVEQKAYERIAGEILEGIERAAGMLDGIYLDLHGAMVCEHIDDGEGHLISDIRDIVGPNVPIAVSLDLHGNVTHRMVDNSDVLVAFRTYPHIDMAETGRRAAIQLDLLMERREPFRKAFRRVPYLIPIPWQCTDLEPAKSIYRLVAEEERGEATSTSFLTGFPAADFEGCGPTVLAYGTTQAAADVAADRILHEVMANEGAFAGRVYSPEEGVAEAIRIAQTATRPVVLADAQDNPGAGGDSDTTGMLRALLRHKVDNAAIGLMVDPAAARAAHEAGVGARLRLALGGHSGIPGDAPYEGEFTVEVLSDGRFETTGPYYGRTRMNLGPSTRLAIEGVRIVVSSYKAQLADQAMYRFVGIEPGEQAILVNKSSVHFRADFEPIAERILICAAPGALALDPADLPWTKLAPGMRLSPGGAAFGKGGRREHTMSEREGA